MKYDLNKPLDTQKFKTWVQEMLEKKKRINVSQVREKRSIRHNAYLHVCITIYAIEQGYTVKEMKEVLKEDFGVTYQNNSRTFLKSTSDYDSKELSEFIERIRNNASQNGVYIPTSAEYLANQFDIDKHIEHFKQYI